MKPASAAACALLAALLLAARGAGAQALPPPGPGASPHRVTVAVALEPALVFSLDYTYDLAPADTPWGLHVGGGLKVPTTLFSQGAWRAHLIGSAHWRPDDRWGAALTSFWYLARNSNRAGEALGLGVELRATPGWFGPRWMAALDLGWQGTLLTRIRHSARTRAAFDELHPPGAGGPEGPLDGWYGPTGHRFRAGLAGGYRLGGGAALQLALGGLFVLQEQGVLLGFDFAQIPFYLEASLRLGG